MDPVTDPGRLVGVLRILRPLVRVLLNWSNNVNWSNADRGLQERLRHVDDVIQMVVQDLEQPAADTAVVQSVSSNLNSIAEDMQEILLGCTEVTRPFRKSTWKGAENTVRFIDSLIQIFQDIYDHKAETIDIFIPAKKEIFYAYDELKFVETIFLLMDMNPLSDILVPWSYLSYVTEEIAVEISLLLYNYLVYEIDDAVLASSLKGKICRHQSVVKSYYELTYREWLVKDVTIKLDERVVGFFGYLIEEMRKLLSHNEASFLVAADVNEIEILVDELSSLRCNLLDVLTLYLQEEDVLVMKEMRSLCVSTQILILNTGFLIYFSRLVDEGEREKERANYWRFRLPGLLAQVESLKQQASDLFSVSNQLFRLSTKSCSSTNQTGCITFLIKNLEKLMHSDAASINPLNHQIQTIYQETLSSRNCLAEIIADDHLVKSQSQIEFLRQQFEEAANKSSFIIDSILAREGPLWYHKLGMFVVQNHIKVVEREVKAYSKKMIASDYPQRFLSCLVTRQESLHNVSKVGSKDKTKGMKMEGSADELVGVRDATTEVIELLTSTGANQLKILSIVGMPGLGKTTLANSVYEHPSISIHFHLRAWCCASQSYVKEALLIEILSQIVGETRESLWVKGEDLAPKIRQKLKGRKYLIVIDDIWDVKLWNDLRETFPDDHSGSRILFTTRNRAVALETNSIPYALRLLSIEESRELLLFKVFDRENCPPELSVISNRIARNCKGLPLAVVLIAGILKRTEKRKDSWEQVAKTVSNLHSEQANYRDIIDFTNILEFSYKHLPDYLKPCFVYFGAFPEDTSISVSKLIRLWISEGFVGGLYLGEKSLKQEAEDYLRDLIDRSLVMIAKTSSKGGVKACHVHDVLREFCRNKLDAEGEVLKEGFLNACLSSHGNLDMRQTTYLCHYRSYRTTKSTRSGFFSFLEVSNSLFFGLRLDHSESKVFRDKPAVVRRGISEDVLVMGTQTTQRKRFNYDLISKFLLLRVLDLGNVSVESSADTSDIVMLAKLVHLRYLAIRPRGNDIPTEIGNLRNLETLALIGVIGVIMLPESIWNLASLRHLLSEHGFFCFPHCSEQFFENFSQLDNLKSISTLPLRRGNNVEKIILRRLPSIEKLG